MTESDLKTDNIMAQWQTIQSQYQIPVMAQFHGFDTEAKTTFRAPVDTHNVEKGLIKVKINQSERMRTLLRAGVKEDALYDYVLNDGVNLADQVITRTKVVKNELMYSGKVTIKENNLNLTVDYGVPANQTNFTLDFGSGATEDIPAQLQRIVDAALAVGVTLTGILTSKKVLTKLRKDAAVQKAINGNIGVGSIVKQSALFAWLDEEYGISRVVINDQVYNSESSIGADGRPVVNVKRYYPDNKVTFFATAPSGRLGIGLWGDPPEVDLPNMISGSTSSISPYVYISQKAEWDPAVLWTKASGLFMPVLYNPSSLFIATTVDSASDESGKG